MNIVNHQLSCQRIAITVNWNTDKILYFCKLSEYKDKRQIIQTQQLLINDHLLHGSEIQNQPTGQAITFVIRRRADWSTISVILTWSILAITIVRTIFVLESCNYDDRNCIKLTL